MLISSSFLPRLDEIVLMIFMVARKSFNKIYKVLTETKLRRKQKHHAKCVVRDGKARFDEGLYFSLSLVH